MGLKDKRTQEFRSEVEMTGRGELWHMKEEVYLVLFIGVHGGICINNCIEMNLDFGMF